MGRIVMKMDGIVVTMGRIVLKMGRRVTRENSREDGWGKLQKN
jgi:hypothetical protein